MFQIRPRAELIPVAAQQPPLSTASHNADLLTAPWVITFGSTRLEGNQLVMLRPRSSRISGQRVRDERYLAFVAAIVFGAIAAVMLVGVFQGGSDPNPSMVFSVREMPGPQPTSSETSPATARDQPSSDSTTPMVSVPTGGSIKLVPIAIRSPTPADANRSSEPSNESVSSGGGFQNYPLPVSVERGSATASPSIRDPEAGEQIALASTLPTTAQPDPAHRARVFIHYSRSREIDHDRAISLARTLRQKGFEVADIRPVDLTIRSGSVRYFFSDDRAGGDAVLEAFRAFYDQHDNLGTPPRQARNMTSYNPKPNNGTIEIWLPTH